jgi:hypothetical protein
MRDAEVGAGLQAAPRECTGPCLLGEPGAGLSAGELAKWVSRRGLTRAASPRSLTGEYDLRYHFATEQDLLDILDNIARVKPDDPSAFPNRVKQPIGRLGPFRSPGGRPGMGASGAWGARPRLGSLVSPPDGHRRIQHHIREVGQAPVADLAEVAFGDEPFEIARAGTYRKLKATM